ncbi:hypothetical protein SERLA73DRAFT_78074 [Serpula lacrymans var. lacrymans S7.3]|uniref:Uncharacterized protein n=2 Tax=Serpula lacrymans var. lacrymans TaxID=341189 RepID=F8QC34_SERL3|nr:uncharacterized protein SERLADRAFT_443052 [Serpula lacrymans var. lacrymans S7.9]EGN94153.1 hypothetical protein SERLA73DRAFT_78074 [Serpula lacrymans var. lacrymans S7.3]EGO19582.1 hypothetical protein SERLADRAFT_443052 [Serpula lacrymans var. lacrymans S7.9]
MTEKIIKISLSAQECFIYNWASKNLRNQDFAQLRVRQVCDHPYLLTRAVESHKLDMDKRVIDTYQDEPLDQPENMDAEQNATSSSSGQTEEEMVSSNPTSESSDNDGVICIDDNAVPKELKLHNLYSVTDTSPAR